MPVLIPPPCATVCIWVEYLVGVEQSSGGLVGSGDPGKQNVSYLAGSGIRQGKPSPTNKSDDQRFLRGFLDAY